MPLYEYECATCHKRTEKIQKFSDPEITICPHCGGPLERTITAPAFQFAGGGWYKDGYGNAKPAPHPAKPPHPIPNQRQPLPATAALQPRPRPPQPRLHPPQHPPPLQPLQSHNPPRSGC